MYLVVELPKLLTTKILVKLDKIGFDSLMKDNIRLLKQSAHFLF